MHKAVVGVMVLAAFALGRDASADTKKAKALNLQGMKKYKKKKYWEAQELFAKAIAEDETYVTAHYNLASMAALQFDLEVATRELNWLKASTDPEAAKKLAKAPKDPDIYPITNAPAIRELLGMPAIETLPIADALFEGNGAWGMTGDYCGYPWFNFTFKKNGKVIIKAESGCDDNGDVEKETATWKVVDGKLQITSKKIFPDAMPFSWKACSVPDTMMCLVLEDDRAVVELAHGVHLMN